MNEDIKIVHDEDKIILSTKMVEKIKYLTKNKASILKEIKNNEINIKNYNYIINKVLNEHYISSDYSKIKNNKINYDTTLIFALEQKYKELYSIKDALKNEEIKLKIFNVIYEMEKENYKYNLTIDLMFAQKDCTLNMKYFTDKKMIDKFNYEYEKAVETKNIEKMKKMLDYVQGETLQEWMNYFNDLDKMTDDNFSFIGHSTDSTNFNGNFISKYISSSLFNQDLTYTYHSQFGFIFSPKNILGAKSRDMLINNNAEHDDEVLPYSSIKKIDHPQRLIDESIDIKSYKGDSVYSEVIIKGFEPIGIFCFTNGSEKFDRNYDSAKKLQQNFSKLKIYKFDIMKRKQGLDLEKIKIEMLEVLLAKINNYHEHLPKYELSKFDYFFEKYQKLKESGNYTDKDIEKIYNKNIELISPKNNNLDDLFDGRYTKEEIKYILDKNKNYNIESIFNKRATSSTFNNLRQLFPYKDRLKSIYEGIDVFLELLSEIEVNREMKEELYDEDITNFYLISKIFTAYVVRNLNNKEQESNKYTKVI